MKFHSGKNLKLICKRSTFIDPSVIVGNNVTIYENNRIEGITVIGDNCTILPGNHIKDCIIESNVTIESSNIEKSTICEGASIGPFSRLRPNSVIGKKCKVGNFVEIKNSTLGDGTKTSHLTYVGDSEIGKDCNIGCGVIFINYDSVNKHRSTVGDHCFIGSNVNVIAPVNIAKDSYICAGTTVTKNTNPGDFVIGRAREEAKPNRAYAYFNKEKVKK